MDEDYLDEYEPTAQDDLSLPKATVGKIIHEMLPSEISCAKETRDLLVDCCVEFIHLVSSEANELCEKENKKTISPEHIMQALEALGFSSYVKDVNIALDEHKNMQKERDKKVSKRDIPELSEEELLRQQEALFEQARLKYLSQSSAPPT